MTRRIRHHEGLRRLGAAAALAAWLLPAGAVAQPTLPESDLKAQILVRSLLFVEWPEDARAPGQPLVVCTAEAHPAADALERQSGQSINGRRLLVRRTTVAGLATCHVAVVGAALLATLKPTMHGVLLVADTAGALEAGAMLNLQTDQGRVVFDVNLGATRHAGIDISTRLLRLARYVRRDASPADAP